MGLGRRSLLNISLFPLAVAAQPPQPAGNKAFWRVYDPPNLLPGRRPRKSCHLVVIWWTYVAAIL
jgi:hypothetical protein